MGVMLAFEAFGGRPVFAGRFFVVRAICDGFLEAFWSVPDFALEARLRAVLPLGRPDAGFPDFLRVFGGIRLPFVAFAGSLTIIAAGFCVHQNPVGGWANLTSAGYGDKRIYLVFGTGWAVGNTANLSIGCDTAETG